MPRPCHTACTGRCNACNQLSPCPRYASDRDRFTRYTCLYPLRPSQSRGAVTTLPSWSRSMRITSCTDTESSSYMSLNNLADLVRQGRDFVVYDANSGEDITRSVLSQIIVEGRGVWPNVSALRGLSAEAKSAGRKRHISDRIHSESSGRGSARRPSSSVLWTSISIASLNPLWLGSTAPAPSIGLFQLRKKHSAILAAQTYEIQGTIDPASSWKNTSSRLRICLCRRGAKELLAAVASQARFQPCSVS